MNPLPLSLSLTFLAFTASANPMMHMEKADEPGRTIIKDADTFDAGLDEDVRLKDWDGPEQGFRALAIDVGRPCRGNATSYQA